MLNRTYLVLLVALSLLVAACAGGGETTRGDKSNEHESLNARGEKAAAQQADSAEVSDSKVVPVADSPDQAGGEQKPSRQADRDIGADSEILPIGESPILGDPSALVTVVAFSDFECPYCWRGAVTMHRLQQKYPNDVRVVFKHYLLPFHQQAPAAAKAAIAAGNQGEFWGMHDRLFENQGQIKRDDRNMKQWAFEQAGEMGLDVVEFERDFDASATQAQIDRDMELGEKLNVGALPLFFVNGERVAGAKPLSAFETIVKRQIREVKEMQQEGVARGDVYKEMVEENYAEKPDSAERRPNKPKTTVE